MNATCLCTFDALAPGDIRPPLVADPVVGRYTQVNGVEVQVKERNVWTAQTYSACLRPRGLIGELSAFHAALLCHDGPAGLLVLRLKAKWDPVLRSHALRDMRPQNIWALDAPCATLEERPS